MCEPSGKVQILWVKGVALEQPQPLQLPPDHHVELGASETHPAPRFDLCTGLTTTSHVNGRHQLPSPPLQGKQCHVAASCDPTT